MNKLILIGLFVLVMVGGYSQDFHYTLRNYTAVDGLPQSQVVGMAEDKNGYLWMGTQGGGLTRFDGREFKTYNVPDGLMSSEVWGILIDKHEFIWTLHPGGISRFDGLHFKKYPIKETHQYMRLFTYQDTIFLLGMNGLVRSLYNDSLYAERPITKDRKIIRLHQSKENKIFFILDDGSILIQSSKERKRISAPIQSGKPRSLFDYHDQVILQTENGLYTVDEKSNTLTKKDLGFELANRVILFDDKRNIFWTTVGPNLIKETFKNKAITRDTILHQIPIMQVYIDSDSNTWIATSGNGIYKYFIQDFDRCTSTNIQGVMSVFKDSKDSHWIGTMTKGIWRINKGKINSYVDKATPSMPYRNVINCITEDAMGQVWAGSKGGLGKYNAKLNKFEWIPAADGRTSYAVRCISPDDHGGIWATTEDGLGYLKNDKWETQFNEDNGLTSYTTSLMYSSKFNSLFIGSENTIQQIKNNKISNLAIKGINNLFVLSMKIYHDSLLVAGTGGGGLFFYNPATKNTKSITTRDGLTSDFIYFVTPDEKDRIWIGTEKGIDRIKLNGNFNVVENIHYGYENGLLGVETNQNSYYISPTEKYFGLVDGVYQFNDNKQTALKISEPHLTDIQILYGEYPSRQYADSVYGFFKIPYHMSLPPDKNHVTFYFNKVNKQHPKSIKFKYFLENFDKAWSQPTAMGQATYGNLPPGQYTFHVVASDSQGSWSTKQITYSFTIQSPFYLQATFIVGALIMLAGIVTLILYARVKQRINKAVLLERIRTEEQESLRKEIARDFHDEMGNQLTRIINYISLLKLNGQSGFNHTELYNKVEDSAKYLYTGTRDFIWSIDPVNDELSKLFIHIRDFGEKLFEEKSIQFRAFNEIKEKIKLPYGFSREANLIFKEAMTNAFKYSKASNVNLSLLSVNDNFQLIIEDDGIGFYTGNIETSNGLKNIRERADKINATLRISSVLQQGTKITLNFKLTKTLKYGLAL